MPPLDGSPPAPEGTPDDAAQALLGEGPPPSLAGLFDDDGELDWSGPADEADEPLDLTGQHVTAILVAHDGRRWLPFALPALLGQTRPADRVAAVDTGSRDDTHELLVEALGADRVVDAARRTGFGAAVALGLAHADSAAPSSEPGGPRQWVWLLHDDCAPSADALERLLAAAVRSPSLSVVGPKVRGWHDRRALLEVGVTIAGNGRRVTGLERHERDQGQHDRQRDVLAVGSAGLLVRREVWDQLGGFDPLIAMFRDDLDFGWRANLAGHRVAVVPDAVVHHAEAGAHRRRPADCAGGAAHRADRRSAVHVLLANCSAPALVFVLGRLIVGTLVRALGFALSKAPAEAAEELGALASVLARPGRILAARRARRDLLAAESAVPRSQVRPLLAPAGAQFRHTAERLGGVLAGSAQRVLPTDVGATEPLRPTTGDDDDFDAPAGGSRWGRLLSRPGTLLALGLLALAAVAARALLGSGVLQGGALLPAPDGAGALLQAYAAGWNLVSTGGADPASPATLLLAALALPLLGSAHAAVDLVLLASVPMAGMSMYLALRRLALPVAPRVWAAVAYALLPAATGAVASGRLGTALLHVLLPPLALAFGSAVGLGHPAARPPWRRAVAAGLLLAVVAAFAPVAWVVAAAVATAACAATVRSRGQWARAAVVLVVPALALVPWTAQLARQPQRLLLELGPAEPGLSESGLSPLRLLALDPGGPGTGPTWLWLALVGAALFAFTAQQARRPLVRTLWACGLAALAVAAVLARVAVAAPETGVPAPAWPGPALVVFGGALTALAVVAVASVREWLAGRSFGWRQPAVAVVAVLAAAAPLVAGIAWAAGGAGGPLAAGPSAQVPAFVAASFAEPARVRTLLLAASDDDLRWTLLRGPAAETAQDQSAPTAAEVAPLDALVRDLASGRVLGDEARRLASFAVAYVVLPDGADHPGLVARLDESPALKRAAESGDVVWRVQAPVGRVRLLTPSGTVRVIDSGPTGVEERITPGPQGRVVQLAERADSGWRAWLDPVAGSGAESVELTGYVADGWAQAFRVPPQGGVLRIEHRSARGWWLALQAAVVVALVVVATPGRRRDPDEDAVEDVPGSDDIDRPRGGGEVRS